MRSTGNTFSSITVALALAARVARTAVHRAPSPSGPGPWLGGAVLLGLLLLEAGYAVSSSAGTRANTEEPIVVTDFRNRELVFDQPVERIVCLIESSLSNLYMLGAEDRLVGISTNVYQESVFPYYAAMDQRIRDRILPTPGNWDFVNHESLMVLQPDLVIIWAQQEEAIQTLEERGIPVFGVFMTEFADIHRQIEALGRLTGTEDRARELLALADGELERARQRLALLDDAEALPRAYFMWAQGPLQTAGKNSTVQELLELAGATNVAAGSPREQLVVNLENILIWDPEVIIMWANERLDPADVRQMAGWRGVSAVRNGRVHELPDVFSCDFWTLKYLFTVELVSRWCHPEHFAGDDLYAVRAALFDQLYQGKLPAAELPPLTRTSAQP